MALRALAVALAAALPAGCGGGGPGSAPAPPPPARLPVAAVDAGPRVDRRSPDASAALILPGAAHEYACRTRGAVEVRFDPSGTALVTTRGRVLAYANLDTRVIRRDCRLIGPSTPPTAPGGGIRRSVARTAVSCPAGPVVRIDLHPLAAPFWGSDVVVADAAGRRLIASAVLVRDPAGRGLYRASVCGSP